MIEMTIIYERDAVKILEFPTMKKKKERKFNFQYMKMLHKKLNISNIKFLGIQAR